MSESYSVLDPNGPFLDKFRAINNLPNATADDMFAVVMVPGPAAPVSAPAPEGNAPAIGNTARYAAQDHVHPRLASASYATLDANSVTSVPFTRKFSAKPSVVLVEDATDNPLAAPAIVRVQSWIMDGAQYAGCTIRGYRSQPLPTLTPVSVGALLSGVITALNSVVSSLTGYNVFAGSAAGANVSVIAIARSDV